MGLGLGIRVLFSVYYHSNILSCMRGVGTGGQMGHVPHFLADIAKVPLLNPKVALLHNHSFAQILNVR